MVEIKEIKVTNSGSGYSPVTPPTVFVYDDNDQSQQPKGPQGIIAELSPTIDEVSGAITSIDVVNSGRNYLPTQNLKVFIDGGSATADVVTQPIYYSVDSATEKTPVTGITTVTFTEFIPYELFGGEEVSLKRISRILTSSHSFEYIGTGTDINTSTPFARELGLQEQVVPFSLILFFIPFYISNADINCSISFIFVLSLLLLCNIFLILLYILSNLYLV
jgi:hypothetical protein